ncbi:MAG: hypothetical protein ACI80K_002730 [Paracoccaceae bacterium]
MQAAQASSGFPPLRLDPGRGIAPAALELTHSRNEASRLAPEPAPRPWDRVRTSPLVLPPPTRILPVEADRLLARMCRRHALDPEEANDLTHLVKRAIISPTPVRKKILGIIDGALARRADGDPSATLDAVEHDLDEEVLLAVARRVHSWEPGTRLDGFGLTDS